MTFEELQKNISIIFQDTDLLKQAFVHRSYLNEAKHIKNSNERLEFLGDSVLSLLTSHYLYKAYPDFPEGTLTNIRSGLVKTKSLAEIAQKLELGNLLMLSRGEEESGGRKNASLLADVFEALLGAIYLDQGLETCRRFLSQHLFVKAAKIVEDKSYLDFKSLLQEIIQEKSKVSPVYQVVKHEGPDHAKIFWVEVSSNGMVLGSGSGRSKQEAEQKAAAEALVGIQKS